jgi:hypothetical protein
MTASRLAAVDLTEWTNYTPVWTSSGTTPTLGNGTLTGRYVAAGDTCFVRCYLKIGSTSNLGSGAWGFSLPFSAAAPGVALAAWLNDASLSKRYPASVMASGTFLRVLCETAGGFGASPSVPFTWAVDDELCFAGSYEIG